MLKIKILLGCVLLGLLPGKASPLIYRENSQESSEEVFSIQKTETAQKQNAENRWTRKQIKTSLFVSETKTKKDESRLLFQEVQTVKKQTAEKKQLPWWLLLFPVAFIGLGFLWVIRHETHDKV
ncbi:MAG: hypothetical protein LBR25_09385 [Erysipelotrichaceae bacterium]|jgi:hypothetical protein|nr:hypothetical protein [Erysipelotrichaceae bacterium]